jgi:hypothetical protein
MKSNRYQRSEGDDDDYGTTEEYSVLLERRNHSIMWYEIIQKRFIGWTAVVEELRASLLLWYHRRLVPC